jgi:hypothetical protein
MDATPERLSDSEVRRTLFEPEPSAEPVEASPPIEVVAEEEPAIQDVAEPPARQRFNPWLAALWVLAILLVALGVWGQVSRIADVLDPTSSYYPGFGDEQYETPSVQSYYVLPVVLATFSPWFFALGFGGVIAAITVHAVAWVRRP